ncbi:MAG: ATP-grasp domain-containing protein [Myxococcales bacterium]|nr:ATP-grasp domain-containing protein [Myxococcales bacterium]MCB9750990.1 ATP-grasp domain-containing protein [Myxococcales bacterium]
MHVLFVAPHFPAGQREFVRALHSVGARVTGIGEADPRQLGDRLRGWLHGYEQVPSVCDEEAMLRAVRRVQQREWVDRLEATIEAHILPTARVRAAAGIPGLSVEAAILCRDKPQMKEFLREHGIPCARSTGAASPQEIAAFVREVGFPVILKPRAGAGASGTYKVDDAPALEQAIVELGVDRGNSVAVEEFISGHEGFYDTLTVGGEVAHEFICHYYPNVLEAMRTRWISPQIVVTNRLDAPGYEGLKRLGQAVIRELGLGTTATHMEWFYGPKGLKFSEIGARPPGVSQWDLYAAANDLDIYREWAHAIVHGRVAGRPSRRFASGIIALRPDRDGRIRGYSGVEDIHRQFGRWVVDSHLPAPGTPTQPIEAGYMANAWIRMRHPDYDELRSMLDAVGQTVHVYAG